MIKYIDCEAAAQLLRKEAANKYQTPYDIGLFAAARAIESFPAADVVPMSWVREHMSGDYISREQAVENAIDQMRHSKSETAMRERLLNLVAADVRPVVKARWDVGADGWECSNCTIESNNTYPICPYCGAEMEES